MPNDGIAQILTHTMPHPGTGIGIPRCELYLGVEDVEGEYEMLYWQAPNPLVRYGTAIGATGSVMWLTLMAMS